MRSLALFATTVAVATLALPAGAASPPANRVAQLERQVTALRAKIRHLETENCQLSRAVALAQEREDALKRRLVTVDPCRVTRPNGSRPPGSTFGAEFHGTGALWVGLPPANVVAAVPAPDGSLTEKFGSWREVAGRLRIEGRRLDGWAAPLRASVPDGYGGFGFQSSSLAFPVPGCWEVTGRVGDSSLTFVTLVIGA